jgi:hypothetical protein
MVLRQHASGDNDSIGEIVIRMFMSEFSDANATTGRLRDKAASWGDAKLSKDKKRK